jgi:beta-lactamase class C
MRFDTVTALAGAFIYLAATCVANAASDADVEKIVAREVQTMLPPHGGGGVAVAIRSSGRTLFFSYGQANAERKLPVGADSIFNLASVSKLFAATLLAQAVEQGELRLDDPVADYVTELQEGGDIRRITLLQLATHTSGLPRVPQTMSRGIGKNIRCLISSVFSNPGRRTRIMNQENRTSTPTRDS